LPAFERASLPFIFADFGGFVGYSILIILIGLIGMFLWSERKKYTWFIGVFVLFFILSFYIPSLRVLVNLFLVSSAPITLEKLFRRVWSWEFLRQATALIILCTILFSAVSFASLLIRAEPTEPFANVLTYLKERDNKYPVISHQENAYYIEYFSAHSAFSAMFEEEDKKFSEAINTIFYSIKLDQTEELLKEYGVGYVLLTPDMKKGSVWTKSDEGLLFIFENSETFINIYESQNYELWAYTAKEDVI
jgi:hypothetical protein